MKPAPVGNSKQFELTPKGNHVARLTQIINIGTIPTTWQGEERMTHKVRLSFELCNERKAFKEGEEEKPFTISREFTYSMAPKAHLRPFVEGMIGAALTDEEAGSFLLKDLLGTACLLNVVHEEAKNGNTYANIIGASTLPKGMTAPEIYNEAKLLDIDDITEDAINELPDFIRLKMKSSQEWMHRKGLVGTVDEIDPNGIPF